jgi:hypothetical protein
LVHIPAYQPTIIAFRNLKPNIIALLNFSAPEEPKMKNRKEDSLIVSHDSIYERMILLELQRITNHVRRCGKSNSEDIENLNKRLQRLEESLKRLNLNLEKTLQTLLEERVQYCERYYSFPQRRLLH